MDLTYIIDEAKKQWIDEPSLAKDEKEVIERFGKIFHPSNLDKLREEDFRAFYSYNQNRHWHGIERTAGLAKDLLKLKKTLKILLDESIPIRDRIKRIRDKQSKDCHDRFGFSSYTPILLVVYPTKYGVINAISKEGLKKTELYTDFDSKEEWVAYDEANKVMVNFAKRNNISLWQLDYIWDSLNNTYTFTHLKNYIENEMNARANYQPVMLKTIIDLGSATKEVINQQILKYNPQKEKNFASKEVYDTLVDKYFYVLEQDEDFILNLVEPLTDSQRQELISLCENKINRFNLKNDTGYFLIQAGDFGSNHILNKGFYQHEGWQTTPRDSAHGEVKIGDVLLVYFTSTARDHQKTLKMIYQVKSISKNNVRFYLEPKIELKGLSLDTVRNLIQNKQLSDIFNKIAQQGFNIAKISKVDFETVLKIDGNTLDVVVNEEQFIAEKELQNDTLSDIELSPFIEALKWKPNLILYGPPGTGKTYYANEIAKLITRNQNSNEIIADFKQQTWLGIAAKILLENNGTPINYNDFGKLASQFRDTDAQTPEETIARDIRDHIRKFGDQSIFSNPKEGVYGLHIPTTFVKAAEIILLARHEPMQSNEIAKVIVERNLVETKGETPERTLSTEFSRDRQAGENSTFIQIKPGTYALRNQITNITKKSSFIKMVTFHPSYSYEDFVEGFRPNVNDSSKQPYVLEDGIFKLICQSAKNDPDNWYVLLIDEINRGNIPKILGELITLIEKDKRNEKYALTLAYRKEDFFVPENLKIIATMNTADKSLMQMDDALKRRFVFEELMPDTTALLEHLKEKKVANAEDYKKILDRINEKILGKGEENDEQKMKQFRDRQIGHSYFWEIKNDENLQSVIKYDIIPLLQDYFYGDYNEIRKILGTEIISGDSRPTNLVTDKSKANELKMELLKI